MRRLLIALALVAALPASARAACMPGDNAASIADIVERVHAQGIRYVFVGEQHGVGPVKRFAVDLANALAESGDEVGLYVEGFRTDCAPADGTCDNLARLFNPAAFHALLAESRTSVHAIDPVENDRRVARMAATIGAGAEPIRVVLVGSVHVLHAEDDGAELWVYGGGMRYPDPGDLAEAFPRRDYLTVALETADLTDVPYRVRKSGCAADYFVAAPATRDYWSHTATAQSAPMASPAQPAGH